MAKQTLQIKRAYEEAEGSDGRRVLVDRLWPRGISKERAKIADWLKEIAPSDELRKWFAHEPEKFAEFQRRYEQELQAGQAHEALQQLEDFVQHGTVTLIYAAKDSEHNNAVVLRDVLQD